MASASRGAFVLTCRDYCGSPRDCLITCSELVRMAQQQNGQEVRPGGGPGLFLVSAAVIVGVGATVGVMDFSCPRPRLHGYSWGAVIVLAGALISGQLYERCAGAGDQSDGRA